MSRPRNPFSKGTVLAVLAVGAIAFLLMLYALGRGWTGDSAQQGGAHARSNGLNGYAGLVTLLEDVGYEVEVSRNRASLNDYGLLVLTPQFFSDPDELAEAIDARHRNRAGPTLVILPKWYAAPPPDHPEFQSRPGWVVLFGARSPSWLGELDWAEGSTVSIGRTQGWSGLGHSGSLPAPDDVQAMVRPGAEKLEILISDSGNHALAGQIKRFDAYDQSVARPIVVVFEPDLVNNFGLSDRARAQAALALVNSAMGGENLPVIFDMTIAGLGASENLLTLAFRPPFLAATLCLLLAALVIAWRAFHRFGPPLAEAPAMAHGKRQLALNGASLVERVKRFHLLKSPYEALIGRRIANHLGLRVAAPNAREEAIDRMLAARGYAGPEFSRLAAELRAAKNSRDILRAARALRDLERNLLA